MRCHNAHWRHTFFKKLCYSTFELFSTYDTNVNFSASQSYHLLCKFSTSNIEHLSVQQCRRSKLTRRKSLSSVSQLFISRAQCAHTALFTAKGFTHPYISNFMKSVPITEHTHQLTRHERKCFSEINVRNAQLQQSVRLQQYNCSNCTLIRTTFQQFYHHSYSSNTRT